MNVERRELRLELRDLGAARVHVFLLHRRIAIPLRDPPAEIVDPPAQLFALLPELEARPVRELERATADEEIERADAGEMVSGLENEDVADPLRRRRRRVQVSAPARRADDDRRERRDRIGEPLGLSAACGRERDEDLRARLLQRLDPLRDRRRRGGHVNRQRGPQRRSLTRRAHADDAYFDSADVAHDPAIELCGLRGAAVCHARLGRVRAVGEEERSAARRRQLPKLRASRGPLVHAGRERDEPEVSGSDAAIVSAFATS